MKWKRLTIDDLRLVLAEDEVDKLENRSLDEDVQNIIQSQLDCVADAFRGAWKSKGYEVDVREHYDYARYQIWTRFPMTEDFALSEPRKKQYEEAQDMLRDPILGTSKPDYSDDPELSSLNNARYDNAISVPWLKFPPMPWDDGFPEAYWRGGVAK